MKIEELDDSTESIVENKRDIHTGDNERRMIAVSVDEKRALVGAGARILFYPTLLYNVFRNKIQAEFRWWDQIDQFPFPKDVPRLKQLGVGGVITLNEPYETLVPTSLGERADRRSLRAKYCATLLLSDVNDMKNRLERDVLEFSNSRK
ncbi:hypothetical protein CASFOL_000604 [Castilleja foliolosa]|uniref:Dual specificity protein phosphatase DSP8 n=1 Tax=Castilleja foliolosa TaxID=1961234 RepID=A0ABD3EK76_9LAMI